MRPDKSTTPGETSDANNSIEEECYGGNSPEPQKNASTLEAIACDAGSIGNASTTLENAPLRCLSPLDGTFSFSITIKDGKCSMLGEFKKTSPTDEASTAERAVSSTSVGGAGESIGGMSNLIYKAEELPLKPSTVTLEWIFDNINLMMGPIKLTKPSSEANAIVFDGPSTSTGLRDSAGIMEPPFDASIKKANEEVEIKPPSPCMLNALVSNLYRNLQNRVPGAMWFKCQQDPNFCERNHLNSEMPKLPSAILQHALEIQLEGQQYETYLAMVEMFIMHNNFPHVEVFDAMVQLTMVLIAKDLDPDEVQSIYHNRTNVFYLLLNNFPPCWTALRSHYLSFLGIEPSNPKLELFLSLLEMAMDNCTDEELTQLTVPYEKYEFNFSDDDDLHVSKDDLLSRHVNDFTWSNELSLKDFGIMSPSVQLARIFDILDIIYAVLERNFLMWLEHHKKSLQVGADIFKKDTSPFAVLVFGLTPVKRLTKVVRKLMMLYSRAVNRSLHESRLAILQSFISLLMELSNTAELEYVSIGVRYPCLGPRTRQLIAKFFYIFCNENTTKMSTFKKTIPQLGQPYLRYEFADHFLRLFYFPDSMTFCPEKICNEFRLKMWKNYMPRSEVGEKSETLLAREDYMQIMLNALRDYCKWMNLEGFWENLKHNQEVEVKSGSLPAQLEGNYIPVDVREMIKNYVTAMRHMRNLRVLVVETKTLADNVDVRDWITYLKFLD